MAGSQNPGEASDNPVGINVTAMVDIIFCLCLFFMCSFHFKQLQGKIETWLPKEGCVCPGEPGELMKGEIVVVMHWDPAAGRTVHGVRHQPPAGSAEELMQSVLEIADGYKRAGNTVYLGINSAPDVPWRDVVHVMDLCKGNKIERLEFAAPQRAIEPQ